MSALEQTRALVGLRALLFWRRLREGGRAIFLLLGVLLFALFSTSICWAVLEVSSDLAEDPTAVQRRGGPMAVFTGWLGLAVVGRLWFGLVGAGQGSSWFLDPRRFRQWPVPAWLLSSVNFAALLCEPVWLLLYPVLVCIALGIARLPGAPGIGPLVLAEAVTVLATVGVLHLGAAVGAAFDARPMLRRTLSIVLAFAGFAGFQLATGSRSGLPAFFARQGDEIFRWTPIGWAASFAEALQRASLARALALFLLLAGSGVACGILAHELSKREVLRPPETRPAPGSAVRARGWQIPLAGPVFSALFEKEMKTVLRIGWLQLVLVPVAFLLLRMMMNKSSLSAHPLLVAAVYAHLGVLDLTTNAFGRDVEAARAYFLWPVSRRLLLAAKNAVAYTFSLMIFALLAVVAYTSGPVPRGEVVLAVLAHGATFPLLATIGNIASSYAPSPVRGARLRRVRGAGPLGVRIGAMMLLLLGAWAPWALSALLSLPRGLLYAGELVAMVVVYGGLLGFAAHLLERRREPLLAALRRDE